MKGKNGDPVITWNLWSPPAKDGERRQFQCKVVASMTDRALDVFRLQDLEQGKDVEPLVSMELPKIILTPTSVVIRSRVSDDIYILTLGDVVKPLPRPSETVLAPPSSAGFTGTPCQSCGHVDTIYSGTCLLCTRCGSTSGCS